MQQLPFLVQRGSDELPFTCLEIDKFFLLDKYQIILYYINMKGDNKMNLVIYFTGFAVWFIFLAFIFSLLSFFLFKGVSILLRRPYYCIKHLLPWKWWSQEKYQCYLKAIEKSKKSPDDYSNFIHYVELKRKNNFAILIDNDKNKKWYQPKYHFIYIKGVK